MREPLRCDPHTQARLQLDFASIKKEMLNMFGSSEIYIKFFPTRDLVVLRVATPAQLRHRAHVTQQHRNKQATGLTSGTSV